MSPATLADQLLDVLSLATARATAVPAAQQVQALAAGKIVLDGGVGKMIEMARANVRNIPRPAIAGR